MAPLRINPLSRRPSQPRLVLAVRGAAGSGKSRLAASMADAGLGRLCFFDTERKARLIPGADGSRFDGLEIQDPDELPEFIDWALEGEGRAQQYGCFALDSWAMYFGRKHRKTIQAVRERSGDPTALPGPEELEANQTVYQEVLRRLCVDSGKCVVITDQIPARGKEQELENQRGRVLPMTTGGLEYFVDVMVEMSVRARGFEKVYVAQVVKSNTDVFPVGLEIENPTFQAFLERMQAGPALRPAEEPAELPAPPEEAVLQATVAPALEPEERLARHAAPYGLTRENLLVAARHYCRVASLDQLTDEQVDLLIQRMDARYGAQETAAPAAEEPARSSRSPAKKKATGKKPPTESATSSKAVNGAVHVN